MNSRIVVEFHHALDEFRYLRSSLGASSKVMAREEPCDFEKDGEQVPVFKRALVFGRVTEVWQIQLLSGHRVENRPGC